MRKIYAITMCIWSGGASDVVVAACIAHLVPTTRRLYRDPSTVNVACFVGEAVVCADMMFTNCIFNGDYLNTMIVSSVCITLPLNLIFSTTAGRMSSFPAALRAAWPLLLI